MSSKVENNKSMRINSLNKILNLTIHNNNAKLALENSLKNIRKG
jgi:hypothetical protein